MNTAQSQAWPELPYDAWRDTCATLQLWTQIVGKIRLVQTPWLNHSWQVPLYVTVRGLDTSAIPYGARSFDIAFDFIEHVLAIDVSDGAQKRLPLKAQSVAEFFRDLMAALADLGIAIAIDEHPCELAAAIPFSEDRVHASYDPEYANRFWRVLLQVDRVLKAFRTGFLGKASPVHFFWGSFDLAVTRFSGRRAPLLTGKTPGVSIEVMQEAYSHEVSSAGFWPGGDGIDASFYSYAYPEPPGFRTAEVEPAQAGYDEGLGQFLLPYAAVRAAADPQAALLAFLRSSYAAAARAGNWDRDALECDEGMPGKCRRVDVPGDSG